MNDNSIFLTVCFGIAVVCGGALLIAYLSIPNEMPPGYQLVTDGVDYDWVGPDGRASIWSKSSWKSSVIASAWSDYKASQREWKSVKLRKE